jgi:hypothetical protein
MTQTFESGIYMNTVFHIPYLLHLTFHDPFSTISQASVALSSNVGIWTSFINTIQAVIVQYLVEEEAKLGRCDNELYEYWACKL